MSSIHSLCFRCILFLECKISAYFSGTKNRFFKSSTIYVTGILISLSLPSLTYGISEFDGGASGSIGYYQQTLASGLKSGSVEGNTGIMTYGVDMGEVKAVYSSAGGGGWTVGTTSRITRSPRWGVPKLNDNDVFLLDGQELVCKGDGNVCATGDVREYYTKNQSYSSIQYFNAGGENSFWKVREKDGTTHTYGKTPDSRIVGLGRLSNHPRVWAINKTSDFHEKVKKLYTYKSIEGSDGAFYLDRIVIGVSGATQYATTKLSYTYLETGDRESYHGGSRVVTNQKVSKVEYFLGTMIDGSGGTRVSQFDIKWRNSGITSVPLISSIREYGTSLNRSRNPIQFTYQSDNENYKPAFDMGNEIRLAGRSDIRETSNDFYNGVVRKDFIDFNHDGYMDSLVADDNISSISLKNGSKEGLLETATLVRNQPNNSSITTTLRNNSNGSTFTVLGILDINGDGLPDLVGTEAHINSISGNKFIGNNDSDSADLVVCFNTGNLMCDDSSSTSWAFLVDDQSGGGTSYITKNIVKEGVDGSITVSDLIDINGDRIPDLVSLAKYANGGAPLSGYDPNDLVVRAGTGSGFVGDGEVFILERSEYNYGVGVRQTIGVEVFGTYSIQTIADLVDMNGDGLPDRVWEILEAGDITKPTGEVIYFPGTGGHFDFEGSITGYENGDIGHLFPEGGFLGTLRGPTRKSIPEDNGDSSTKNDLIDFNGDGLIDAIFSAIDGIIVIYNSGYGNDNEPSFTLDWQTKITTGSEGFRSSNKVNEAGDTITVRDLRDFDGDGILDLWSIKNNGVTVNRGINGTDLLIGIENGIGGKTAYAYKPVEKGPGSQNENYPSTQWLVSTVTVDNSFGQVESTFYEYSGGVYDRLNREDRGFQFVEITHHDGSKTKTEYYVDNALAGKIKKRVEYSSTNLILSYQVYEYENFCSSDSGHYGCGAVQTYPSSLSEQPQVEVKAIANTAIHSYAVDGTTSEDSGAMPGGTNWARFKELYEYDQYGNTLTYANYGVVDNTSGTDLGNDASITTWTYTDGSSNWLFLHTSEVSSAYDGSGNFRQSGKIEWIYDDSNIVDSWSKQKIYKSATDEDPAIHKREFFSDGNLESETDPVGIKTRYEYDHPSKMFRTREVLSPPKSGSSIELSVSYTFDSSNWRLTSETDPNGQVTSYEYDEFGRITKISDPVIGDASHQRVYSYREHSGPSSPYKIEESHGAVFKTIQFFDGFGGNIQTKVLENEGGYSTTNYYQKYNLESSKNGFWEGISKNSLLTTSEEFDKESYGSEGGNEIGGGGLWTRYISTSGVGRMAITYEPNGLVSTLQISKFKKTEINSSGHATVTESLPGEQITKVTRHNYFTPLSTTTIKQSFDGVELTDDDGNTTTIGYNWLGYKVFLNDLSFGNWSYTYDNAGKVLTQLDAKGLTITYEYDCLGRLITKTYPDNSKIEWYYDGDDNRDGAIDRTAGFLKGRLSKVVDSSGTVLFGYDAHGNKVWESKTIDGITKTTTWTYDMLGRVIEMRYPDDTQPVKLHYALSGGGLIRIEDVNLGKDILSSACINCTEKFGELTKITFGNGTSSQFKYSDKSKNFRLSRITHSFVGLDRDFNYEHDALGNVQSINSSSEPSYSRSYAYDGLSRLVEVSGTGSVIPNESFTYSGTNNLLIKSINDESVEFDYGIDQRPYQVTRTTNSQTQEQKSFGYDANGNMVARNGQTITYNYDNMPIKVQDTSSESTYTYDFSENRVKTQTGSNVTLYFNPYFEIRSTAQGTESIKHYYMGGTRIATHAYTGTQSGGETQWYHGDHLGSTASVSNSEGQLVFEGLYTAFGEIAVATLHNGEQDEPIYKYTGKELDGTGLYYYESRFYDPTLGKFIQPDTLLDKGPVMGMNRYAYTMNNPVTYRDPDGHLVCGGLCVVGIGVAIGAVTGFAVETGFALGDDGSISGDEWKQIGIGTFIGGLAGGLSGGAGAGITSLARGAAVAGGRSIIRNGAQAVARAAMKNVGTQVLKNVIVGAGVGAISNASYQGLSIAAGIQKDGFSFRKLGLSVGLGVATTLAGEGISRGLKASIRRLSKFDNALGKLVSKVTNHYDKIVKQSLDKSYANNTQIFVKSKLARDLAVQAQETATSRGAYRVFATNASRMVSGGGRASARVTKLLASQTNFINGQAQRQIEANVPGMVTRYSDGIITPHSITYKMFDGLLLGASKNAATNAIIQKAF